MKNSNKTIFSLLLLSTLVLAVAAPAALNMRVNAQVPGDTSVLGGGDTETPVINDTNLTGTNDTVAIVPGAGMNESAVTTNETDKGVNVTVVSSNFLFGFDPVTGLGDITLLGVAFNNDTRDSSDTDVLSALFDVNGTVIATNATKLIPPAILINQSVPFSTKFSDIDIVGGVANAAFYQQQVENGTIFLGVIPLAPALPLPPIEEGGAIVEDGSGGATGGLVPGGGTTVPEQGGGEIGQEGPEVPATGEPLPGNVTTGGEAGNETGVPPELVTPPGLNETAPTEPITNETLPAPPIDNATTGPVDNATAPTVEPTLDECFTSYPNNPEICEDFGRNPECQELFDANIFNFQVEGDDPFELDGDNDGVGCEISELGLSDEEEQDLEQELESGDDNNSSGEENNN